MTEAPSSFKARPPAESTLSVWARRAVSVPLYGLLSAVCLGGLPVWAAATAAADLLLGPRGWPRTRALGVFALYLGSEVVGVLAATLIAVATLGGRVGGPQRYLDANAALQRGWTGALFHGAVLLFSMKVDAQGLELAEHGPFLLFVRHTSTADTVLAAAMVANPHRLLLRYVLKRELLWDPCLDIVGRRLPNAFVDRSAARTQAEVLAVAGLARDLDAGSAVLIYPEGTRFAESKRGRSVAALRERKQDALADIASTFRHVLPPRLGGALALLDAAPDVDVILLEHTGFEGAATFASFWGGGLVGTTIRVRLRRIAAATIPRERTDEWLFSRWAEMDDWISSVSPS